MDKGSNKLLEVADGENSKTGQSEDDKNATYKESSYKVE